MLGISIALSSWFISLDDDVASDSSDSSSPPIDPEDPMRDYLISKRKEEKALKKIKKSKSKSKHKDETPEERRARKARKREKKDKKARKVKSEGMKGVEDLLSTLGRRGDSSRPRSSSPRMRRRSLSPSQSPVVDRHHRQPTRSYSRPRSPTDDYNPRNRHPIGYSDERQSEPRGHESHSRRTRDND